MIRLNALAYEKVRATKTHAHNKHYYTYVWKVSLAETVKCLSFCHSASIIFVVAKMRCIYGLCTTIQVGAPLLLGMEIFHPLRATPCHTYMQKSRTFEHVSHFSDALNACRYDIFGLIWRKIMQFSASTVDFFFRFLLGKHLIPCMGIPLHQQQMLQNSTFCIAQNKIKRALLFNVNADFIVYGTLPRFLQFESHKPYRNHFKSFSRKISDFIFAGKMQEN